MTKESEELTETTSLALAAGSLGRIGERPGVCTKGSPDGEGVEVSRLCSWSISASSVLRGSLLVELSAVGWLLALLTTKSGSTKVNTAPSVVAVRVSFGPGTMKLR